MKKSSGSFMSPQGRFPLMGVFLLVTPLLSYATDVQYFGISISKIRAVGDYQGTTFDGTLEVWPTGPLTSIANCRSSIRFYINATQKHLIAAAYLALATGRKLDINLDDTLPIRDGACEASYIDIASQ